MGLVFQGFEFSVFKVNRAWRFAKQIGAQASGDARALRRLVNFFMDMLVLLFLKSLNTQEAAAVELGVWSAGPVANRCP